MRSKAVEQPHAWKVATYNPATRTPQGASQSQSVRPAEQWDGSGLVLPRIAFRRGGKLACHAVGLNRRRPSTVRHPGLEIFTGKVLLSAVRGAMQIKQVAKAIDLA